MIKNLCLPTHQVSGDMEIFREVREIYSLIYNGTQYYYVKNLQGDVVQIRSIYRTVAVEYSYEACALMHGKIKKIGRDSPKYTQKRQSFGNSK